MHGTLPTEDKVHIWIACHDSLKKRVSAHYNTILCGPDEQRRYQQLLDCQSPHRLRYLIGRYLLRHALCYYLGTEYSTLPLSFSAYGRPFLGRDIKQPLIFSLSHAQDLTVCAFASNGSLGVDVEWMEREVDIPSISHAYYAETEREELHSRSGSEQRRRFFQHWTLKESYLKARGVGLNLPLQDIAFDITGDEQTPSIRLTTSHDAVADQWKFWTGHCGSSYVISVATDGGNPVPSFTAMLTNYSK